MKMMSLMLERKTQQQHASNFIVRFDIISYIHCQIIEQVFLHTLHSAHFKWLLSSWIYCILFQCIQSIFFTSNQLIYCVIKLLCCLECIEDVKQQYNAILATVTQLVDQLANCTVIQYNHTYHHQIQQLLTCYSIHYHVCYYLTTHLNYKNILKDMHM